MQACTCICMYVVLDQTFYKIEIRYITLKNNVQDIQGR